MSYFLLMLLLLFTHWYFLTAILHHGLWNCFFLRHIYFFPYSFWTFIPLFSLDFYFPFLSGHFFSTHFQLFFISFFKILCHFLFNSFSIPFLFKCGHILDFFHILSYTYVKLSKQLLKYKGALHVLWFLAVGS